MQPAQFLFRTPISWPVAKQTHAYQKLRARRKWLCLRASSYSHTYSIAAGYVSESTDRTGCALQPAKLREPQRELQPGPVPQLLVLQKPAEPTVYTHVSQLNAVRRFQSEQRMCQIVEPVSRQKTPHRIRDEILRNVSTQISVEQVLRAARPFKKHENKRLARRTESAAMSASSSTVTMTGCVVDRAIAVSVLRKERLQFRLKQRRQHTPSPSEPPRPPSRESSRQNLTPQQ